MPCLRLLSQKCRNSCRIRRKPFSSYVNSLKSSKTGGPQAKKTRRRIRKKLMKACFCQLTFSMIWWKINRSQSIRGNLKSRNQRSLLSQTMRAWMNSNWKSYTCLDSNLMKNQKVLQSIICQSSFSLSVMEKTLTGKLSLWFIGVQKTLRR